MNKNKYKFQLDNFFTSLGSTVGLFTMSVVLGINPAAPFHGFCMGDWEDTGGSENSISHESGGSLSFMAKNSSFQLRGDALSSCLCSATSVSDRYRLLRNWHHSEVTDLLVFLQNTVCRIEDSTEDHGHLFLPLWKALLLSSASPVLKHRNINVLK